MSDKKDTDKQSSGAKKSISSSDIYSNPKDSRKKTKSKTRVLVGMNGGIDSTVTAFLLKKQGLDVIGAGVLVGSTNVPEGNSGLNNCNVYNLRFIQEICHKIDIPFYAIEGSQEYEYKVIDKLVAHKLVGQTYPVCVWCNVMKLSLLVEKSKKLNAQHIATGHYAKIQKNASTGEYRVSQANDQLFDQSYLLSKLNHEQLSKLLLPLGELRKVEVKKIAEKYNLGFKEFRKSNQWCMSQQDEIIQLVEEKSSEDLREEGHIFATDQDLHISDHKGIYLHYIGQSYVDDNSVTGLGEEKFVVGFEPGGNKVIVGDKSDLLVKKIYISELEFFSDVDQSKPIPFFIKHGIEEKIVEGKCVFKNNSNIILSFEEPVSMGPLGGHVVFYNTNERGAKVLGSGVFSRSGEFKLKARVESIDEQKFDDMGNPIEKEIKELRF